MAATRPLSVTRSARTASAMPVASSISVFRCSIWSSKVYTAINGDAFVKKAEAARVHSNQCGRTDRCRITRRVTDGVFEVVNGHKIREEGKDVLNLQQALCVQQEGRDVSKSWWFTAPKNGGCRALLCAKSISHLERVARAHAHA
eukprot:scaffold171684_cov21-Tisochrysis_lutea.AAC.1